MISKLLPLTALAAVVQLTGCQSSEPAGPASIDGVTRVDLASAPAIVTQSGIAEYPGSGTGVSGTATLTRSPGGLAIDLAIDGLMAGSSYTVWWVLFDNPGACEGNGCGAEGVFDDDFGRPQVHATAVNATGFVATSGTNAVQAHLARHDVGGNQVIVGDPSGVDNPYQAQVNLVIRNHGPAESDPAALHEQLNLFQGHCNLTDPVPPFDEIEDGCLDSGVAAFLPPGAPGRSGS